MYPSPIILLYFTINRAVEVLYARGLCVVRILYECVSSQLFAQCYLIGSLTLTWWEYLHHANW